MARIYVYSTLTNDAYYGPWVMGGGDLPCKPKQVLIYGGANRADRDNRLYTPRGVVTTITQAEYELCMRDAVFHQHRADGFITVTKHDTDPDKVAESMEARSGDAPITPAILEGENAAKPEAERKDVVVNAPAASRRGKSRRGK